MVRPIVICLTLTSLFLFQTLAAAQEMNIEEVQHALRARICPANPQRIADIRMTDVCGDDMNSDFFQTQACQQKVYRENEIILKYNSFIDRCIDGSTRRNRGAGDMSRRKYAQPQQSTPPTSYTQAPQNENQEKAAIAYWQAQNRKERDIDLAAIKRCKTGVPGFVDCLHRASTHCTSWDGVRCLQHCYHSKDGSPFCVNW